EEKTMGDVMRGLGYRTIAIGKWHLGLAPDDNPVNRGFDEFFGFQEGGMHYLPFRANRAGEKNDEEKAVLRDGLNEVELGADDYLTDVFADQAADRIRAHRDVPW